MEVFFLIILGVGALYLLLTIFSGLGDVLDFSGIEGVDEAAGISLNVIASFMVAFGAVGLSGSLAGWHPIVIIGLSTVIGYVIARLLSRFIRFIYAQQSDSVESSQRLVGMMARVTINTSAGKTGEAIIEGDQQIIKYSVREVNSAPLERGDRVQIVSLDGRMLNVKKKHTFTDADAPKPIAELFDDQN